MSSDAPQSVPPPGPLPPAVGKPVDSATNPHPTKPPPGAPDAAEPLQLRGRVAAVFLVLVGLTALASLWADLNQLDLITRLVDGERVTTAEATESDDRVATTAIIYLVALVLSAITFLLWYSRAYRNTIAMGVTRPRYGTRWAVAYWFIPIVSLFRPKQVMNDIWRGSEPDMPSPVGGVESRPVSPLLHWWWAFWILSIFIGNYAARVSFSPEVLSAEELRSEAVAYVVTDIADVIAVPLAIAVVVVVTRRQEARRERVRAGTLPSGPPVMPPPVPPGWG
ncbi:MAG: DUF4328 domain-containing protein [Actinomycetota bacterium]|nr:DUF4328 domain-containing protein [Actinomycetota bacterium]